MTTHRLHTLHQRSFDDNKFVYPVLSRRSRGLSIGVNLNPDKICNFDCIYCQVNRRKESETRFVETDRYFQEVDEMLRLASAGEIWKTPKFAETPSHLRRVNDIAFSGDGEPTTYRNFDELVERTAEIKRHHG
ncbi:MAG: radical SAM protein, partial [Blastopirellula sp. JB062]